MENSRTSFFICRTAGVDLLRLEAEALHKADTTHRPYPRRGGFTDEFLHKRRFAAIQVFLLTPYQGIL